MCALEKGIADYHYRGDHPLRRRRDGPAAGTGDLVSSELAHQGRVHEWTEPQVSTVILDNLDRLRYYMMSPYH